MADAYQELNQRNFQALSEGLKSVRAQCEGLAEEVKSMREANSDLLQQVATLRQQNGYLLARFHGTGSTS
jgi:uncharacterized coiled-coil DUF342 family protein